MTVKELKEFLDRLNPDMEVVAEYHPYEDDPYEVEMLSVDEGDFKIVEDSCLVIHR